MFEGDLTKEINIAIRAAMKAGKLLNEDKDRLKKLSLSDKRDTKLLADITSEDLILHRLITNN